MLPRRGWTSCASSTWPCSTRRWSALLGAYQVLRDEWVLHPSSLPTIPPTTPPEQQVFRAMCDGYASPCGTWMCLGLVCLHTTQPTHVSSRFRAPGGWSFRQCLLTHPFSHDPPKHLHALGPAVGAGQGHHNGCTHPPPALEGGVATGSWQEGCSCLKPKTSLPTPL